MVFTLSVEQSQLTQSNGYCKSSPQQHMLHCLEKEDSWTSLIRLSSDETDGRIMREFCALCAKSYTYILKDNEKMKAKVIRRHVVKKHMTFQDHKQCLFGDAS